MNLVNYMYINYKKYFDFSSSNIIVQPVTKKYFNQILDLAAKTFLENEPLFSSFPPCVTGARERDFRRNAIKYLEDNLSIMALHGSKVVGSSLNAQLTREDVFCQDDVTMNCEHSTCFFFLI